MSEIATGWLIGYLTGETDSCCEYRLFPVIGYTTLDNDKAVAVLIEPDGAVSYAHPVTALGERAFAVGPEEDPWKAAQAHAAARGRTVRAVA